MRAKKNETAPKTDDVMTPNAGPNGEPANGAATHEATNGHASATTEEPAAAAPPAAEKTEIDGGSIGAEDQELLERSMRFLVGVQSASYLKKARREGYTTSEHELGWRLFTKAAGADRPLEHWFVDAEPEASPDGHYQQALLRELDTFEGIWLPRVRALMERVVPEDAQEALASTFFEGLAANGDGATHAREQALSPALIGRVRTLLDRVEKLDQSDAPGAVALAAKLVERGLTPQLVKNVRAMCAEADGEKKPDAKKPASVSPEVIRAATEAQLGALKELRRWFNDWATMFRTVLPPRDQARLGLVAAKTRATQSAKTASPD